MGTDTLVRLAQGPLTSRRGVFMMAVGGCWCTSLSEKDYEPMLLLPIEPGACWPTSRSPLVAEGGCSPS